MLTFDFPLSPKARTYLKFETLFKRMHEGSALTDSGTVFMLLRAIVDFIDLVDGSGALKMELIKDLKRWDSRLGLWQQSPDANQDLINQLRNNLSAAHAKLDAFSRQRTVLRDDPILSCIKPHFVTPCGINSFDTPLFYFWQSLDLEQRRSAVSNWLNEVAILQQPIDNILYLWRLFAQFEPRKAVKGFWRELVSSGEMISVRYDEACGCYPIVSGSTSSFNVRFIPYTRGTPAGEIKFELACISEAKA